MRTQAFECQSGDARVLLDPIAGTLSFVFFMPYYLYMYVLWNHVSVCVSIIIGLVLYYCMGILSSIVICHFCMPRVMIWTHFVKLDLVCPVVVLGRWWKQFRGIT